MLNEIPNDLDEAVAARLERQRVLYSGGRRFIVVLEDLAVYGREARALIAAASPDS